MKTLQVGDAGQPVKRLQRKLLSLGFPPGTIDGEFGYGTEAAVLAFQRSTGLLADGIAGPRTLTALGLSDDDSLPTAIPLFTITVVSQMFPSHDRVEKEIIGDDGSYQGKVVQLYLPLLD